MQKLLLGNEAVARGLYEAGVSVVSSYPGTPSTEITEFAATYDEMYCEWAPNEKVAVEVAIGASMAGKRAFAAMKHVGLNVAADPLFTVSYIGVHGGLVIGVADDPGMHSSQNEQDSRHYARASKVPMLEPSTSEECLLFTKLAFELSEQFDTPVLLRLSTRVAHSRSFCTLSERCEPVLSPYQKDIQKNVMMPAMAIKRHPVVEERLEKFTALAEETTLNRIEEGDPAIGVITSGISYTYVKEALGDRACCLKLGMVHPLPVDLIRKFAAKVDRLYVVEELDDIIETHCRKHGISVIGKEVFPLCGEFSQEMVREKILGEKTECLAFPEEVPGRPPVMCAGCPHRGTYYALKKLGVYVSGDIGCYSLGAAAPLSAVDTVVCMGASVSGAHGYNKAVGKDKGKATVAVIGDSTFIHSGVTGLINVAYNQANTVTVILDNSITGMTGHQQNPTTGLTIKGDPTAAVDLEALAKAVGINRVKVVDPYDIDATYEVLKEEIAVEEPSVVIARRPCALLKNVKHNKPFSIDADQCKSCKACFRIGCPAIMMRDGKAAIDNIQCVGCGECLSLCKFGAICKGE
ncbi:MAG TPA: indolepyruvate ferredoxin oxidoreductase subunit alpha [Firmicutes bacterium]|nr:indolepyruvate ferredoxin oxidoreductase subunit alpha [Bacillota bacterium]